MSELDYNEKLKNLEDKLELLVNALIIKYQSMTVKEWLEKWIELYKTKTQSPTTLKETRRTIKNHLSPILEKDIVKITTAELQTFIDSISLGRTRKAAHTLLKDAFNKAYEDKIMPDNVFKKLSVQNIKRKSGTLLKRTSKQNFKKLFAVIIMKFIF